MIHKTKFAGGNQNKSGTGSKSAQENIFAKLSKSFDKASKNGQDPFYSHAGVAFKTSGVYVMG